MPSTIRAWCRLRAIRAIDAVRPSGTVVRLRLRRPLTRAADRLGRTPPKMFEPITGSASSTRTVSKALPVMVVPRIVGESPSSTYHREAVIAEVCSQEAARVRCHTKVGRSETPRHWPPPHRARPRRRVGVPRRRVVEALGRCLRCLRVVAIGVAPMLERSHDLCLDRDQVGGSARLSKTAAPVNPIWSGRSQ